MNPSSTYSALSADVFMMHIIKLLNILKLIYSLSILIVIIFLSNKVLLIASSFSMVFGILKWKYFLKPLLPLVVVHPILVSFLFCNLPYLHHYHLISFNIYWCFMSSCHKNHNKILMVLLQTLNVFWHYRIFEALLKRLSMWCTAW